MQLSENKTFALQTDLGLFCRTGMNEPPTSIQEHTFHYRRLVFDVVEDTLETAFPIARKLVGKKRWKAAVTHFFENHKCQTPQVWRLPQEFCEYYQHNDFPTDKVLPFLKELLQYEWLEIEVFMMEDLPITEFKQTAQAEGAVYVPNPEIKILALHYPVHIKNSKKIVEEDKGQYFVSIHRDYYSKQVKFNDLSYPFVEILVEMNEREMTKNELVRILMKYEADIHIVMNVLDEFEQFAFASNIVLGYKK
ncbi:HvfC/BufC N-terminal domain-containing protein [Elizabethkingia anophelis]|uniref:HvfC/BufC N-terminal domain-containing protein n=1 Tax=Elizabethkingia anophelis TaxID=1117645 RepID=UPI001629E175|nr:putative DNA-binding domain-containing protein [Elizabethkingia anophelis]MDV4116274.1 hypothetical protein [Elizabethkingia anophelis]